jgi:DNA-binding PadR family transcriptional regulator
MSVEADLRDRLPLAPHVFQILLSLLDGDLHGYALLKDIARRTDGEMVLGTSTLYAAVQRLVKEGFLEEVGAPPEEQSLGPARRYFRITGAGRGLARAEARRVDRLHRMVTDSALARTLGVAVAGEDGP